MPSLPFPLTASLRTLPNTVIVPSMPCAVWPARVRLGSAGDHYDHQGEAPMQFFTALSEPNRYLLIGAVRYVIVAAEEHLYLPHVSLRLRRTRNSAP